MKRETLREIVDAYELGKQDYARIAELQQKVPTVARFLMQFGEDGWMDHEPDAQAAYALGWDDAADDAAGRDVRLDGPYSSVVVETE